MEKNIQINGYIVEKDDPFFEAWFGMADPWYFASDSFLKNTEDLKEGDSLSIDINTDGGSCDAGIRIYNACKDLQKKGVNVTTFNRGKQHSIGNVIVLGGQTRKAYQSSTGVIHLPYVPADALWGQIGYTAEDLEGMASDLRLEEDRILDIYVKETGKSKDDLRAVMNQERNLSAKELLDLGFLTEIVDGQPAADPQNRKAIAYVNLVKSKNGTMEKDLTEIKKEVSGLKSLFAPLLNLAKKFAPVNMDFSGNDGNTLHVVRESGDMAIGDEATINDSPDGEITLEDGTYVKVEGGKITEITPASTDDVEDLKNQLAAKDQEIANLTEQLNAASNQGAELANQVQNFASKFAELENAVTAYVPQGRANGGKATNQTGKKVGAVDLEKVEEYKNKVKGGR